LLRRFSNVFGLAYRRFSDLKQAEAQAREAQIEAALERVRSHAMAMHTAQQLTDVVHELRKQMGSLGQKDLETCAIHLNDDSPDFIHAWAASRLANRNDEILESNLVIPKRGLAIIEEVIEAYSANRNDYVITIDGEKLNEWIEFMRGASPKAYSILVESTKGDGQGMKDPAFWSLSDFQGGSLIMVTLETPDETSRALLRRFANVFGLAYRRFADLKQAEAQAREATIEAALEKIRSRSLGMHKSDEIKEVVGILFEKLKDLGLAFDGGAAIQLFSEGSKDAVIWVMSPLGKEPICNNLPYDREMDDNSPIYYDMRRAKETGTHIINKTYPFEQKNKYFEYVFKHNDYIKLPQETRDFILAARLYSATFIAEKNSLLGVSSWIEQDFSENDIDVLKRVARVFEQAYVRFLDLQKAEALAREATIEAALEKIRSRSLGMHKSNEIKDVVEILFEKLKELGLVFDGGAGIHLLKEGSKDSQFYVAAPEFNGAVFCSLPYDEQIADNPIFSDLFSAKETGKAIVNRRYTFEDKNNFFNYVFKHNEKTRTDVPLNAKSYSVTLIAEKNCLLGANSWSDQQFSEGDIEVLKRVARVFEQAYIRFLDLQKAEVHARDAVRQASLDRVRAEIASMRTVQDLDRITPLIWTELKALNIPFIRCGVFIVDEQNKNVQSFLSTPDGKAIAVFELPFDTPGFVGDVLKNWLAKKVYVNHLDEAAMKNFADILVARGIFNSVEHYLSTAPKEGFYQHLLPFRQGMLYVGNLTQLKEDELGTLQLLADAFATAYARYDDFNRLELAKKQVDNALVNLKQAQQQLVQSEKMASLGELTAGIAHEIQNPLNFVNNFSEVSHELMDEIKAEIEAGNLQAAADLVNDIKRNLEKITHHGKRADGIVKGMLQHSRSGSGQKEPTNINVLCDEYVRLAYHGYRAKDKSFNAKFETDFDSTLQKVNVVAQDIGRVILNLINNAFYAVNERSAVAKAMADTSASAPITMGVSPDESKTETRDYVPTVNVSTKKLDDKIEIRVRDNGNGIPETIREKIFQPFFTTKPTGQGTGLGLSLSYDIIKAHGGMLIMNSKEGEGTEFIVQLPFFQLQTGTQSLL